VLRLGLAGHVSLLGHVPFAQLCAEYGRASAFCLPSVQEGFGIVFLEAMAAGKPIVAARAAAAPEIVPHALLVEPESDEGLAIAIERLYRDEALRASQALAGRQIVRQYDATLVGAMFLRKIESLLAASKTAHSL
jgi:glycosyltransferase involved in cell wall biosynthesis